jgi:hypothetical protein
VSADKFGILPMQVQSVHASETDSHQQRADADPVGHGLCGPRPGYGPTEMGSDAVGLTPIGVFVLTVVIVTSTAEAPWLTVKF